MDSEYCSTPTLFCATPTTDGRFTFPQNADHFVDLHNLKVIHGRCFTPIRAVTSPGLSPICGLENNCCYNPQMPMQHEFKVPKKIVKKNRCSPSSPILDSVVSPAILDSSKKTGYLNHTLTVFRVLKNMGLEQYIEAFENEKIDFEKFLLMNGEDLDHYGCHSEDHQKIILDFLKDLNASI